MVTNNTLAAICTYLGLHRFLVYNSNSIGVHIRRYEEDLTKRRTFEDQQLSLGRKPTPGGFWAEVEAPKVTSLRRSPNAS
jgi:endoribonuclease Dicer